MSKRNYKRKIQKQSILYKNRVRMAESVSTRTHQYEIESEAFENIGEYEDCGNKFVSQKLTLLDKLKEWYIETTPSRVCLQKILKILREEGLDVPLSAESLMGKRDQIIVRNVFPGTYCHIGIENQLKKREDVLKSYDEIIVDLNIDGIPLFKSSRIQLWPILLKIVNIEEKELDIILSNYADPYKRQMQLLIAGNAERNLHLIFGKNIIMEFNVDGISGKKRLRDFSNVFSVIIDVISTFNSLADKTLRAAFQRQKKKFFKQTVRNKTNIKKHNGNELHQAEENDENGNHNDIEFLDDIEVILSDK